ncbi:MAG: hypothetical protein RMJ19_02665 [Gemmatales bacterium]|nr:hypothetical protein [Gemmatales bacterium]MCS7159351.1 hypothetical protein [Gemmatales bacterium]MDW8174551.1 hypothetical protein [Gemmatales bacterium]MDW8223863.1 hypothetical protein [Gemmatales bacterium]
MSTRFDGLQKIWTISGQDRCAGRPEARPHLADLRKCRQILITP